MTQNVTFRQKIGRWLNPVYMLAFRFTRGMTLGVRGAILDENGHIFLVRHTYVPGWYLPGGGVDPGETVAEAMAREAMEEGNIRFTGPTPMVSLHLNRDVSRRDHVAFFVIRAFEQITPRLPDGEIAACGFFDPAALPDDVTPATRRRLDELAGRAPASPWW